ncbi:hypothetical protein [Salinicola tamaricis]|uniref:hypothetical protein n=1 Tax=Salinicola tamaricis TaxID=1771309 RepID=UPI000D0A10BF|nr:hypothetical protein [Salinicola tamaricis]
MTHRESTLLVEMLVEILVKGATGALRRPALVNAMLASTWFISTYCQYGLANTVSGVSATGAKAAAAEADVLFMPERLDA